VGQRLVEMGGRVGMGMGMIIGMWERKPSVSCFFSYLRAVASTLPSSDLEGGKVSI
jgi:hypothetical protein